SQNFSFTISAPDAPTLNPIGNKNVNENQTIEFIVSASDPDDDDLVLSVKDLPEGASFSDNGDGTGVFSWIPMFNQSGIYKLTFMVADIFNLKDSEEVFISVNNVKEPPKFEDA